ncbi:hypothetical protein OF83DRAFT_1106178, partial [Amylostereum chailletii]
RVKDVDVETCRQRPCLYKTKFPPPDLSNVLDLALDDDSRVEEIDRGRWRGRADAVHVEEINLDGVKNTTMRRRRAYICPKIPGLVLLPQFLSDETQRELVQWSLCDQARYPNETNLDTHYKLPRNGLWNAYICSLPTGTEDVIEPRALIHAGTDQVSHEPSGPRVLISNTPASPVTISSISDLPKLPATPSPTALPLPVSSLIQKLRWANIGWYYHWGTKQYDFGKGKQSISPVVKKVCQEAVKIVPWEDVFSGQDDEEWGNEGRDWQTWDETYEPDAGIVNFYQTKDTLMAHVDRSEVCATSPLVSISTTRINVNVRQVFPKGFDPSLAR